MLQMLTAKGSTALDAAVWDTMASLRGHLAAWSTPNICSSLNPADADGQGQYRCGRGRDGRAGGAAQIP